MSVVIVTRSLIVAATPQKPFTVISWVGRAVLSPDITGSSKLKSAFGGLYPAESDYEEFVFGSHAAAKENSAGKE